MGITRWETGRMPRRSGGIRSADPPGAASAACDPIRSRPWSESPTEVGLLLGRAARRAGWHAGWHTGTVAGTEERHRGAVLHRGFRGTWALVGSGQWSSSKDCEAGSETTRRTRRRVAFPRLHRIEEGMRTPERRSRPARFWGMECVSRAGNERQSSPLLGSKLEGGPREPPWDLHKQGSAGDRPHPTPNARRGISSTGVRMAVLDGRDADSPRSHRSIGTVQGACLGVVPT